MAATLVKAMRAAGHDRFAVVGHDRGGRVAYRAALDHPECVSQIAVLDVVPTFDVWDRADARLALAFWPFSLLAQPAPLPERLLSAAPDAIVDNATSDWGSSPATFPKWLREAYVDALREPAHVHAICEEYRAAAGIDREIDEVDLIAGRRINCPVLVLWGSRSHTAHHHDVRSAWPQYCADIAGMHALECGHYPVEQAPDETYRQLAGFFR